MHFSSKLTLALAAFAFAAVGTAPQNEPARLEALAARDESLAGVSDNVLSRRKATTHPPPPTVVLPPPDHGPGWPPGRVRRHASDSRKKTENLAEMV